MSVSAKQSGKTTILVKSHYSTKIEFTTVNWQHNLHIAIFL